MKISVIGTGYIGIIQAVGLSKLGYDITSVDIFEEKINKLKSGISTIYEDGLDELLFETYKNINFTTKVGDIIGSEIIFICVGTPQDNEGKTDLGYVFGAIEDIKKYLSGDEIIVIKSTVPVGTNKKIYDFLGGKNTIVSNPEFLREGVAIKDFFNPDRIVLGFLEDDRKNIGIEKMKKIYEIFIKKDIPLIITDWQTRELIKYAANSFLATKITFINEIAKLSDIVGANIKDISTAIGIDDRIGKKFLNAGIGYGGSCFPKDVKSLIHQFSENGISGEIIKKVDETNFLLVDYFFEKIKKYYNYNLHGKKIGIIGVAFKPDTDDIRESRGIEIIKKLLLAGVRLTIFDYNKKAIQNFDKYIQGFILSSSRGFFEITIANDFDNLTKDLDSLVITLEDKKILSQDLTKINLKDRVIFDGKNILEKKDILKMGYDYFGIGY